MTDIEERTSISTGELYYQYHAGEEILFDLIETETRNVWDLFASVYDRNGFFKSLDAYFMQEK